MTRIPIEAYVEAVKKLTYDVTSSSCLRWNNSGKPAGGQDHKGYWLVRVNRRLFKAHRIIWFMHHGTLCQLLDHKNTVPADNRIENLRPATESQNRANIPKHIDNSSGFKGVYWDKRTESWIVKVCLNRVQHHGGRFKCLSDAVDAVKELRKKLHKEFAHD